MLTWLCLTLLAQMECPEPDFMPILTREAFYEVVARWGQEDAETPPITVTGIVIIHIIELNLRDACIPFGGTRIDHPLQRPGYHKVIMQFPTELNPCTVPDSSCLFIDSPFCEVELKEHSCGGTCEGYSYEGEILSFDGKTISTVMTDPSLHPTEGGTWKFVSSRIVRDAMGQGFETRFNYPVSGIPRLWRPLRIARVTPNDGAIEVSRHGPVTLAFTAPIDPGYPYSVGECRGIQGEQPFFIMDPQTGLPHAGIIQANNDYRRLAFVPQEPFEPNTTYEVVLNTLEDFYYNPLVGPERFVFTTEGEQATESFRFNNGNPLMSAPNVALNSPFTLDFSRPLGANTVQCIDISHQGNAVAGCWSLRDGNRRAVFTPEVDLQPNATYAIHIPGGVFDIHGTFLRNPVTYHLFTGTHRDEEPPVLTASSPVHEATDIAVDAVLHLVFDEPLNALTIDTHNIYLVQADTYISVPVRVSTSQRRFLTVTPLTPLVADTTYLLFAVDIEDSAGNKSSGPDRTIPLRFTTAANQ